MCFLSNSCTCTPTTVTCNDKTTGAQRGEGGTSEGVSDEIEDPEWGESLLSPKVEGDGGKGGAVHLDPSLRYSTVYVTDCFVSMLVHRLKSPCYHLESTKN